MLERGQEDTVSEGQQSPPRCEKKTSEASPWLARGAWLGFVTLILLHLDFWREQRPILYLGWSPEERGYRMFWLGLAWRYLLYFCQWGLKGDDHVP